jgi:hypothetical protein
MVAIETQIFFRRSNIASPLFSKINKYHLKPATTPSFMELQQGV